MTCNIIKYFRTNALFVFIFFHITLLSPVFAQEGRVSVESRLDKSTVTVGELVKYEIIITFSPDLQVATPPAGINLGGFEIRDYIDHDPVKIRDLIEKRVEFTIAAYDTGSYAIPPTGIAYMRADSTGDILLTEELRITVESVLSGEAEDIQDIKSPFEIPKNWLQIFLMVSGAILFLGLCFLFYTYYKNRKKGKNIFEFRKEPELPPHEEALNALNRLRESSLLEDGLIKEYYIELSNILRYYLQRRYYKPVLEMTTQEVKDVLPDEMQNDSTVTDLNDILDISDLVKFAKMRPEAKEHDRLFKKTAGIVEQTKIVMMPRQEQMKIAEDKINEKSPEEDSGEETQFKALPSETENSEDIKS